MKGLLLKVKGKVERFGLLGALCIRLLRLLDSLFGIRVWWCFELDRVDPRLTKLPEGFSGRFVEPASLARSVHRPGSPYDPAFLEQAMAEGMDAYAIFHGERLVALAWFARRSPVRSGDYLIHFKRNEVYGYRIDTHAAYRGLGLFPACSHGGLKEYQAHGHRMLYGAVEAHNLASVRGSYRGGNKRVGFALAGRLFGKRYLLHTPGCRRGGIHFEVAPQVSLPERQVKPKRAA